MVIKMSEDKVTLRNIVMNSIDACITDIYGAPVNSSDKVKVFKYLEQCRTMFDLIEVK